MKIFKDQTFFLKFEVLDRGVFQQMFYKIK